jgi:hypothetical protein
MIKLIDLLNEAKIIRRMNPIPIKYNKDGYELGFYIEPEHKFIGLKEIKEFFTTDYPEGSSIYILLKKFLDRNGIKYRTRDNKYDNIERFYIPKEYVKKIDGN